MKNALKRIANAAGSPKFFWFIVALLVLQAVWIALSGLYPMAFDENFHLGVIKLYAYHISPFWSGQPQGADAFSAVARDPSYLYHYLMSFPYRLISAITDSLFAQVIFLRFIDIGLFASGLVLFRRLLAKTNASAAAINLALLLFVLIPVTSLLAAQINYDNMLFPLVAASLLMTVEFTARLKKKFDTRLFLALLTVCLLTSLVKYAFLPIFVVIAVFTAVKAWQTYGGWLDLTRAVKNGWKITGKWVRVALAAMCLIALGLFMERYAVNLVRYHSPAPACDQVLSVNQCLNYGPWARDYHYIQEKNNGYVWGAHNPLAFAVTWLHGMWARSFFAVDGPGTGFQSRVPLPVPGWTGSIAVIGGVIAIAWAVITRRLNRYEPAVLWLTGLAAAFYVLVLWLDNYKAFLHTGHPVAINGRYLVQVLPPVILLGILSVKDILGRREALKTAIAIVAVIGLLWGGGALTYILRSDDRWYWHSAAVSDANNAVRQTIAPITPGAKPYWQ